MQYVGDAENILQMNMSQVSVQKKMERWWLLEVYEESFVFFIYIHCLNFECPKKF